MKNFPMEDDVLIRGGGDLATGVALRLYRVGLKVIVSELPQPLAVRRTVSFSEAVYEGMVSVEGVKARLVDREQVQIVQDAGEIPVIIDPEASILLDRPNTIVVDARLIKLPPAPLPQDASLHIGLGPGFHAGHNCQAVVETRRGHTLGRVYWQGETLPDSGLPEGDPQRVLRAPIDGKVVSHAQIGEHLEKDQLIAEIQSEIDGQIIRILSPFSGILRGLIRPGLLVPAGIKLGDVDPRDDPEMCRLVSDKALAVGGGVLEAIFSRETGIAHVNNTEEV